MIHVPTAMSRRDERGLSMVEMLVTFTVLAMVIAALSTVLIRATLSRTHASQRFESMQMARSALELMARDLRSAGYGADGSHPAGAQPAIAYIDSMQVLVCENLSPWPDTASSHGAPEAYDPAGTPNPRPLVASEWTPAVRYSTGAEIVRWTLDLDNDGQVDANDLATPEGADARRTRTPDDYTLVRQVYGAGTGGVASNNGGTTERISLVLKPGGDVAPLFTVYLNGSSTPWDWSLGPVPRAQLDDITRILVRVTAAANRPDERGLRKATVLETAVRSMRNAPDFGTALHEVDGYVYADANMTRARESGEVGLSGAIVRLGAGRVAYTNADGYFMFRVPAGNYVLKHTPPTGYGTYSVPDSFVLAVASAETRSFADTARTGGTVSLHVWDDTDADGTQDAGEANLSGVTLTLSPGGQTAATNNSGDASLFSSVGNWSVAATLPQNYSATTSNPVTGSMTAGGAVTAAIGMRTAANGTITGTVFNDANGNGTLDGAESGISGVTVTASTGGLLGLVTQATAVTNASGVYTMSLPATTGLGALYTLACAAQSGKHPTTALAFTGLSLLGGQTSSGWNFGFGAYTTYSWSTGYITSMAAADFWENDKTGTSTSPRTNGDVDLLVGQVLVFVPTLRYYENAYPSATLFDGTATALTIASRNFTALLMDSLAAATVRAPDLATGFTSGSSNWWYWKRNAASSNPPLLATGTYTTAASGGVNALLSIDCANGAMPDVLVGSRTGSGTGVVEVWQNSDGATPSFTNVESYPSSGSVPGSHLGEVNAMLLVDLDADGARDLVIGTQTSSTTGEIVFLRNCGRTNGNRFVYRNIITLASDAVKKLAAADVDGDGYTDIVAGTATSSTTGRLLVYRNTYATSSWTFAQYQAWSAPGAVTALAAADVGGSSATDLLVGYVTNTTSLSGGVREYENLGGALSTTATDPTNGGVTKSVVAIVTANFNYATAPSVTAGPYKTDFAIGYNSSSLVGVVKVYVR